MPENSSSKPYELRASLLHLAKEVLIDNAHMVYESAKAQGKLSIWAPVTAEQIITEAEKLYAFVSRR